MTLIHPDGATYNDPLPAECAECGNDLFICRMVDMGDAARIVAVECYICCDRTEFVPSSNSLCTEGAA